LFFIANTTLFSLQNNENGGKILSNGYRTSNSIRSAACIVRVCSYRLRLIAENLINHRSFRTVSLGAPADPTA